MVDKTWEELKASGGGLLIHPSFPDQDSASPAHEGSKSAPPSKDSNQPVDLNRGKSILPGQPGSTPPGFKGYQ